MALWGNDDNLVSSGIVTVNYSNLTITGSGTTFGQTGFGVTGDVIRIGTRGAGGVYYGEAVIVDTGKIAADDSQTITIGSTSGLSGAAAAGVQYYLSQLPKQTTTDHAQAQKSGYDKLIYGISETTSALYDGDSGNYRTEGGGWVGVTTYIDMHGNLRVKSETFVAASGISTGIHGIGYPTAEN